MPPAPAWEVEYAEWQAQLAARRFKTLPKEFTDPKKSAEEGVGSGATSRWAPSPRETAADASGDRHSTHRRLDQRVFLLLRRDGGWGFPHVALGEGETTRSAAERALKEALGEAGFQPYFVGNAPAGHVALPGGTYFFHRCQLIHGKPAPQSVADFAWAAKDELGEYIKDPATLETLQKML